MAKKKNDRNGRDPYLLIGGRDGGLEILRNIWDEKGVAGFRLKGLLPRKGPPFKLFQFEFRHEGAARTFSVARWADAGDRANRILTDIEQGREPSSGRKKPAPTIRQAIDTWCQQQLTDGLRPQSVNSYRVSAEMLALVVERRAGPNARVTCLDLNDGLAVRVYIREERGCEQNTLQTRWSAIYRFWDWCARQFQSHKVLFPPKAKVRAGKTRRPALPEWSAVDLAFDVLERKVPHGPLCGLRPKLRAHILKHGSATTQELVELYAPEGGWSEDMGPLQRHRQMSNHLYEIGALQRCIRRVGRGQWEWCGSIHETWHGDWSSKLAWKMLYLGRALPLRWFQLCQLRREHLDPDNRRVFVNVGKSVREQDNPRWIAAPQWFFDEVATWPDHEGLLPVHWYNGAAQTAIGGNRHCSLTTEIRKALEFTGITEGTLRRRRFHFLRHMHKNWSLRLAGAQGGGTLPTGQVVTLNMATKYQLGHDLGLDGVYGGDAEALWHSFEKAVRPLADALPDPLSPPPAKAERVRNDQPRRLRLVRNSG